MKQGDEPEISLFISFSNGDQEILRTAQERRKMGPSMSLDFPLFRYKFSLGHRLICVRYCLDEVEKAVVTAATEYDRLSESGRTSYNPFLVLVHKYQVLTDQIYGTMENVAAINCYLYPTKEKPPPTFRKQMKKIRESELVFSESYDSVVKGDMDWYEEVLRIRRNSTHFIFGLGVLERDAKGNPELAYLGYEVSERDGKKSSKGVISNRILKSSKELYSGFETCIRAIGHAWLMEVDPSARSAIPFVYSDRTEFREVSLEEYRSGKTGRLITTNFLEKGD